MIAKLYPRSTTFSFSFKQFPGDGDKRQKGNMMLKRLLGHFWDKRRRARRELAGRITAILDKYGSLVLDAKAVEILGCTRKEAVLMLCYLASREHLHVRADSKGRLVILTNDEFERRLQDTRRILFPSAVEAGLETGNFVVARPKCDMVKSSDWNRIMKVDLSPTEDEAVANLDVGQTVMRPVLDGDAVFGRGEVVYDEWFTVKTLPPAAPAPLLVVDQKVPSGRQTLPIRRREPWNVQEEVGQDTE